MKLRNTNILKEINTWYNWLFIGILLIGFILRAQGVFTNSFAYTYDVGRDLLTVREIVVDYNIPLIGPTTGFQGIFYGPWWYYMLTIPFVLSQGNPQGIAIFMALLGCISIYLGYILGRKIGGVFLGLILSCLISFSPPMVSSQIWNPFMALPFILLLFICIYEIINNSSKNEKKKLLYYFGAGISLGLIVDSEIFFGILFSIGVCLSLALILYKNLKLKNIGIFILGFLFILSPRVLFDIRHEFLMTKSFMRLFSEGLPQTHYTPFVSRFTQLLDTFGGVWSYTILNGITSVALILLAILIALVVYKRKRIESAEKNFILISLIIPLTFFAYFLTNSTDIFEHYIVGIPLLFLIAAAIGISQLRHIKKGKIIAVVLLLGFAYVVINPLTFVSRYKDASAEGDASLYRNNLAIIDYVYTDAQGKPFSYELFTPPIHDYTYEYLFLWYGDKKYGYVPTDGKKDVYYILEPDTQFNNYRLNLWLKDRSMHGKVVSDKQVKGGVRVQKRLL